MDGWMDGRLRNEEEEEEEEREERWIRTSRDGGTDDLKWIVGCSYDV